MFRSEIDSRGNCSQSDAPCSGLSVYLCNFSAPCYYFRLDEEKRQLERLVATFEQRNREQQNSDVCISLRAVMASHTLVRCALCALCAVRCALCSVLCALCSVLCASLGANPRGALSCTGTYSVIIALHFHGVVQGMQGDFMAEASVLREHLISGTVLLVCLPPVLSY